MIVPAPVLGQTDPNLSPTATLVATATTVAAPKLTLSTASGLAGASIAAKGSGFKAGEVVDVSCNGQSVGSPTVNDGGSFSLACSVPNLQPGQYGVLAKGQTSNVTLTTTFTVNQGSAALTFSAPQAAPGASLTVTAAGYRPGETVQVWFNGASVGTATVDTKGTAAVTFVVPTLAAGQYDVTATGATSSVTTTVSYTVLAAATPVPVVAPTATPVPA